MKVYVLKSAVSVVAVSSVVISDKYFLVPSCERNQYDVYERGVWNLETIEAEEAK